MPVTLHKIKAWLYPNPLTEDPGDYIARVSSERRLSGADICESAVTRGGADLPAATILHATGIFLREMSYLLFNGFSTDALGYFTAEPHINGGFSNSEERFNSEHHSLSFQFTQGDVIRKQIPSIEVEILGVSDTGPNVSQVTDLKTGLVNDRLTPNRVVRIAGQKLKIAGDHEAVGVYFVNEETGASIHVDPTDFVHNNPSELVFTIPELAAGTYKLQVTTQYSPNRLLKEPRTTVFGKALTVE